MVGARQKVCQPGQPDQKAFTLQHQTQQSATGPTPQRGWIWESIGIFALRSGLLPSCRRRATRFPGLLPATQLYWPYGGDQAGRMVKVFATRTAEAAPYPDPVVVFVVSLLAPLAVADDGVPSAVRASSWQQRQRERSYPESDLSCGSGSAIKRIKAGVKARR